MNTRTFAVVLGTIAAGCFVTANFTACVITGTGGVGGDIGSGGSTNSSSSSSSSSSSVSSTSSGMCDMALKCGIAITAGGDPTKLCPGSASEMFYKAYNDCACAMTGCMAECMTNVCAATYMPADMMTCAPCIQNKCKTESDNCSNDI